jgi:hypothetical protein
MKKAVFGLVSSEQQASHVVDRLLSSGFANEEISILYPEALKTKIKKNEGTGEVQYEDVTERRSGLTTEKHSKAPEGSGVGAVAGGLLGGSLGLLAGIGALAIPGLGAFIAAGPIMAALSGSAIGGSVGLVVGALVGAGIPEYEAKKYEAGLKSGNILISVHTNNDDQITRAKEIMKKEGAKDISSTPEKAHARH